MRQRCARLSGHGCDDMNIETLQEAFRVWPAPKVVGSRLVVTTHCLYPSRNVVRAHVEGGESTAVVSDGGGALDEMDATASYTYDALRVLRPHLKKWDLEIDKKGWI